MGRNLILKSGFRVLRIDNYLDYIDVKTVRISCHELPDEEDNSESDAYYFLTKEEILSMIKKLEEWKITLKKLEQR